MNAKDIYELLAKSKTVYVSNVSFNKLPKKLKQILDNAVKKIKYANGVLYDCDECSDMYPTYQEQDYRDIMIIENFNIRNDYNLKEN